MRIFGWIYIVIFSISAVTGIVTEFVSGTPFGIINGVSGSLLLPLTIVVFILACRGKIKPRKTFIFLSGFTLLVMIYAMARGVLVFSTFGLEAIKAGEVTPDIIDETFVWVSPVRWTNLIIYLLLSAYGILTYLKAPEPAEQPISND